MEWEVFKDGETVGPCDESEVLTAIRTGHLSETAMVRREGTEEWRRLRTHAPFASAIEDAREQSHDEPAVLPLTPRGGSTKMWAIAAGAGVAFMTVAWIVGSGRGAGHAHAVPDPPEHAPVASRPASTTPARGASSNEKAIEALMAIHTLAEATKTTLPAMADTINEPSPGAAIFALWAWKRGKWADFGVKDETTFAKVLKDSDEERGKRYCASGSIIEITAEKFDGGKLDVGLLMDDSMRLFHFLSAGSSGSLVKDSPARFCGVVTGKYDYHNSAGGTGHAIELVGMFDLPENRRR